MCDSVRLLYLLLTAKRDCFNRKSMDTTSTNGTLPVLAALHQVSTPSSTRSRGGRRPRTYVQRYRRRVPRVIYGAILLGIFLKFSSRPWLLHLSPQTSRGVALHGVARVAAGACCTTEWRGTAPVLLSCAWPRLRAMRPEACHPASCCAASCSAWSSSRRGSSGSCSSCSGSSSSSNSCSCSRLQRLQWQQQPCCSRCSLPVGRPSHSSSP